MGSLIRTTKLHKFINPLYINVTLICHPCMILGSITSLFTITEWGAINVDIYRKKHHTAAVNHKFKVVNHFLYHKNFLTLWLEWLCTDWLYSWLSDCAVCRVTQPIAHNQLIHYWTSWTVSYPKEPYISRRKKPD